MFVELVYSGRSIPWKKMRTNQMCDYSAKSARQRAAKRDDHLVTRSISQHTRGFTSVTDPTTAVCLLPGTELGFNRNVKVAGEKIFGLIPMSETIPYKVARFIQVEKKDQRTHHDALEFPDGTTIKLNELVGNQKATVLQLPAVPKTRAEAEQQRRVEYV